MHLYLSLVLVYRRYYWDICNTLPLVRSVYTFTPCGIIISYGAVSLSRVRTIKRIVALSTTTRNMIWLRGIQDSTVEMEVDMAQVG